MPDGGNVMVKNNTYYNNVKLFVCGRFIEDISTLVSSDKWAFVDVIRVQSGCGDVINVQSDSVVDLNAYRNLKKNRDYQKTIYLNQDSCMINSADEYERINKVLRNTDIIIVIGDINDRLSCQQMETIMGAGKQKGILTLCIAAIPYYHDDNEKNAFVENETYRLAEIADTFIPMLGEKLKFLAEKELPEESTEDIIEGLILWYTEGLLECFTSSGEIGLGTEDYNAILKDKGMAFMGVGESGGEAKVDEVVKMALYSGSNIIKIGEVNNILLSVIGGKDFSIEMMDEINKKLQHYFHDDINIIFTALVNEEMDDKIKISLIGTR